MTQGMFFLGSVDHLIWSTACCSLRRSFTSSFTTCPESIYSMPSATPSRKRVVILGSTGSIGTSALKVAGDIPERMEVIGLAAHRSVDAIAAQVRETGVQHVCLSDEASAEQLAGLLGSDCNVVAGEDGLVELARLCGKCCDMRE